MQADFLRRHLSFLRDEDLSCRKKGPKVPLTCQNEEHTNKGKPVLVHHKLFCEERRSPLMTSDLPLSLHCGWSYVRPNFTNSKKKKKQGRMNFGYRILIIQKEKCKYSLEISFSKLIQHFRSSNTSNRSFPEFQALESWYNKLGCTSAWCLNSG